MISRREVAFLVVDLIRKIKRIFFSVGGWKDIVCCVAYIGNTAGNPARSWSMPEPEPEPANAPERQAYHI
jgi:hypothetical protein